MLCKCTCKFEVSWYYLSATMELEINGVNINQEKQKLVRNSGEFERAEIEIADTCSKWLEGRETGFSSK